MDRSTDLPGCQNHKKPFSPAIPRATRVNFHKIEEFKAFSLLFSAKLPIEKSKRTKNMDDFPACIDAKRLVRRLGISRKTLFRWVDQAKFPRPLIHPTTWLLSDLEEWLEEKKTNRTGTNRDTQKQ